MLLEISDSWVGSDKFENDIKSFLYSAQLNLMNDLVSNIDM